ncbi:N/A [soil metagenome]
MSTYSAASARQRAAMVVLSLTLSVPAFGQVPDPAVPPGEPSLEQLMSAEVRTVFGASRYVQRVIDAPMSVSVVTAEEIDRFGYRTLADILRGVRGLHVSYDRNYSYLGVRGAARPGDYNTRVLLLVDGHRLNDNIYDQAAIGTEFPIDVDLIERVEVIRGPSSTLYGTNAFFAVVNVVTRRGGVTGFSGGVESGSLGTRRGRVTWAGPLAAHGDFLVSATGYTSDGQRDLSFPALDGRPGGGRAHADLDRDGFGQLFASARLGAWTAQGVFGTREKGIPTGAYGTVLDDRRNETVDTRAYGNVQYLGDWRGTSLRVRGAYDLYRYDGAYVYEDDGVRRLDVDIARGNWWSSETSGVRRIGGAHLVTAGLELRGNVRQHQKLFTESGIVSVDDHRQSFVWSLFSQDEITVRPGLLLNASLGYDHFPTFGGAATYRGAVIYKPAPNRAWKVIYGTAFRAPNAYELYYYSHPGHTSHLEPERVRTVELAWEQYLATGTRLSGSIFRNRVRDVISQVAEPDHFLGLHYENMEELRATGFGIEAEGVLAGGVHGLASYTFATVQESGGAAAPNAPRHRAAGRLTSPIFVGAMFIGAEVRHISERLAVDGGRVGGVTLARVTLNSRPLAGRVRVGLIVDNLFGVAYEDPGSEEHPDPRIPQDGRTALLRVKWRF